MVSNSASFGAPQCNLLVVPTSDEALEASAQRIFEVSREFAISSSSPFDVNAFGLQEIESCSLDGTLCSSSDTSIVPPAPQNGDIEDEISFLQEKQSLLKKAIVAMKRDEIYEASKARETIGQSQNNKTSSVWTEAEAILAVLNRREGKENSNNQSGESKDTKAIAKQDNNKKRQVIDLSSVTRCSSAKFGSENYISTLQKRQKREHMQAVPFLPTGPWMRTALEFSLRLSVSEEKTHFHEWEVVKDPHLGPLVIPPCKVAFGNGIELREALTLTSHARLICLSAPPFNVVHANKAFWEFSKIESSDIIGRPIESIFETAKEFIPSALSVGTGRLRSQVIATKTPCQLRVLPVTDKFRNPLCGMSHLLVQVESQSAADFPSVDGSLANANDSLDPKPQAHHHIMFGTVG